MANSKIEFRKLKIHSSYGKVVNNIYYVVEKGRSEMMETFASLPEDMRDNIKDLISRIATVEDFKSPKVKYTLNQYSYGEIRPMPHRFFFFQKCGDNFIFFGYELKKKAKLDDDVYKELEKKKVLYEKKFEEFIQGN